MEYGLSDYAIIGRNDWVLERLFVMEVGNDATLKAAT